MQPNENRLQSVPSGRNVGRTQKMVAQFKSTVVGVPSGRNVGSLIQVHLPLVSRRDAMSVADPSPPSVGVA